MKRVSSSIAFIVKFFINRVVELSRKCRVVVLVFAPVILKMDVRLSIENIGLQEPKNLFI